MSVDMVLQSVMLASEFTLIAKTAPACFERALDGPLYTSGPPSPSNRRRRHNIIAAYRATRSPSESAVSIGSDDTSMCITRRHHTLRPVLVLAEGTGEENRP